MHYDTTVMTVITLTAIFTVEYVAGYSLHLITILGVAIIVSVFISTCSKNGKVHVHSGCILYQELTYAFLCI